MPHRIAIATSTGKFIDLHFGHADRFLIADVGENGYSVVETRHASPACQCLEHEKSSFDASIELLRDCEGVFVSKIGYLAAQYVASRGLRVFEAPYFIEDVLKKLISEQILDNNRESGR
jgi:nitrogen fixation protein NifX